MTDRNIRTEFAVLGAGAAGIQMAYFLRKAGRRVVVLDREQAVGSFWRRYPRRRRLISFNKRHSVYRDAEIDLRWDWNSLLSDDPQLAFGRFSRDFFPAADEMASYLETFVAEQGLDIRLGTDVTRVHRGDELFRLDTADGSVVECEKLVVATGNARPYVPPIPGIELAEGYEDAPVDPDAYEDQAVLVIGKGNAAFEIADLAMNSAAIVHLASPHPVRHAWRTRHSGDLRSQYAALLDTYQLKALNAVLDCRVRSITATRDGRLEVSVAYAHANGETETFFYDRVVRCTGFGFDDAIYDETCRPAPHPELRNLPALTNAWESVNVPGMFFAGALMRSLDHRTSASAFVHGFRYNIRTLAALLTDGPDGCVVSTFPASVDTVAAHLLERANRTSGLWSQFGFLADAVTIGTDGHAQYHAELPKKFAVEHLVAHPMMLLMTFEWGELTGDPFEVHRTADHQNASGNVFLHPVIRTYVGGEPVSEHHVLEDLLGAFSAAGESGFVRDRGRRNMAEYHQSQHVDPLAAYLRAVLPVAVPA